MHVRTPIERKWEGHQQLILPPLGVTDGGVSLRQDAGKGVVEVVVGRQLPDVPLSVLRLEHSEKHIDSHLLVGI